jgi:MFS family permease
MTILSLTLQRLNVIGTFKELGTNQQRRETLIALASTQMLVQLSSMPIAMTIPSVARQFNVDVAHAAWIVIIRLLMLGSTVFLAARLGEKYGHVRVYFIGAILMSVASVLSASALSLNQLILWSGFVGVGGALITANANAILAMVFGTQERGRAFSVPVVSARVGALIGLALFGIFLQYFSWRLVFLTSLPIGLLAIKNSYPLLKYQAQQIVEGAREIPINYLGAILMVGTLGAFILSGIHVHDGAESFSSPDAIS